MRGFQLWLNLPAKEKLKPAWYRDIPAGEIAEVVLPRGGRVKVIAGSVGAVSGPINGPERRLSTDPLYLDLQLRPGERFEQPVSGDHTAFAYAYEGSVLIGDGEDARALPRQAAGVLSPGERTDTFWFQVLARRPS